MKESDATERHRLVLGAFRTVSQEKSREEKPNHFNKTATRKGDWKQVMLPPDRDKENQCHGYQPEKYPNAP
jgi:hypothetical protein